MQQDLTSYHHHDYSRQSEHWPPPHLHGCPRDLDLVHVPHPPLHVWVVGHAPPAAMEYSSIHGIKAHDGGEQAQVGFSEPGLEEGGPVGGMGYLGAGVGEWHHQTDSITERGEALASETGGT